MFGVVSLACVVVLFVTGLFLMFFYAPSSTQVVYHGSYASLDGVTMSGMTSPYPQFSVHFDTDRQNGLANQSVYRHTEFRNSHVNPKDRL